MEADNTNGLAHPIRKIEKGILPVPAPENVLQPLPLEDRAVLEGYTLHAPEGLGPGQVIDATFCFRSLKKQDGEFQVTVHLLGAGNELDTAANFVSTPRWPRQRDYLGKEEPFWASVSLRMPLGVQASDFEFVVILGEVDEETRQVRAIPPPIRFAP